MKTNLTKWISLVLAVMMVLPTAVFATETTTPGTVVEGGTGTESGTGSGTGTEPTPLPSVTTESIVLYHDAANTEDRSASIQHNGGDTVKFVSEKPAVATVNETGVVTAKSEGTTEIYVLLKTDGTQVGVVDVEVKSRELTEVLSIDATGAKTKYVVGEEFVPTGLKVTAVYDNGDRVQLAADAYDYSPKTALNVGNDKITVTYTEGNKTATAPVPIVVSDKVKNVIARFSETNANSSKTFTEGDSLNLYVVITYTQADGTGDTQKRVDDYELYVDGTKVSSDYKVKLNDKKVVVKYAGVASNELTLEVKAKEQKYELTMSGDLTKKSYKVGEKFDASGRTAVITLNGTQIKTLSSADLTTYINYTFTAEDVGKTSKTFNITVDGVQYAITISGLTISKVLLDDVPTYITRADLVQTRYPIGYEFSLADVNRIYCRMNGSNTYIYKTPYLQYTTFSDYSAYMDLEVLTDTGRTKSARYAHILEEEDVFTEDGEQLVNLRFTFGDEYVDFTAEVGTSGVSFAYNGKVIKTYASLAAALNATVTQDLDVSNIFDLDDVLDRRSIILTLGEDMELSSSYSYNPKHNVEIDLNGCELTMYTDTIDFTRNNAYLVSITNTAKTSGKLIYDDEDITVVLAKDDELVFEYGEDIPGILTVTVDYDDDHGTVTASPKADSKGKIIVGQGSTITFTIKPDSGYVIDEVEVDSKNVKTSTSYKTTTTGATYTMSGILKNQTITVTFEKASTTPSTPSTPAWNNPFTDVSSSSTYYGAVKFVYENELFKGTTATRFSPNTTMTRAMFVTVLGRLAGVDVSRYKTSSFTDVPLNKDTEWYAPYVQWAVDFGIAQGYGNGKFGPNDEITHQQMYVFIYRYAMFVENQKINVDSVNLSMYDRTSVASWAESAVKYAQQKNFLVLSNSRVNPEGDALRWELATLLQNFCKNVLGWAADEK